MALCTSADPKISSATPPPPAPFDVAIDGTVAVQATMYRQWEWAVAEKWDDREWNELPGTITTPLKFHTAHTQHTVCALSVCRFRWNPTYVPSLFLTRLHRCASAFLFLWTLVFRGCVEDGVHLTPKSVTREDTYNLVSRSFVCVHVWIAK